MGNLCSGDEFVDGFIRRVYIANDGEVSLRRKRKERGKIERKRKQLVSTIMKKQNQNKPSKFFNQATFSSSAAQRTEPERNKSKKDEKKKKKKKRKKKKKKDL